MFRALARAVFAQPSDGRARSPRARAGLLAATLAVAAAGLAQVASPARPAAAEPVARAVPAVPTVAWHPCGDGFRCATVPVPLDYGDPSGATISLALIQQPAGSPRRRIGTLFVNPGGPGGSGVDIVRGLGPSLPLELRGRFDLVGFDPRGVMRSTPLRCFATFEEATSVLPPFAFPYTAAELTEQQRSDRALDSACAARGGAIRDHMSTADVARDMDLLRQAVGDSRLNYLGFSYGSYLGQVYANLFPDRVRALVIDGVLDPVAWSTGRGGEAATLPVSSRAGFDVGSQATLDQFFALCEAAGRPLCSFAGNSPRRYAAMAARFRGGPVEVGTPPDTYTVTYADFVATTLSSMEAPDSWPTFADALLDLETNMPAPRVRATMARLRTELGVDQPPQEDYPNVVESYPGVLCADSVNPRTFDAWTLAAATTERLHGYFGRPWTWASSSCHAWPATAGRDRYLGPWTARTAEPVLVIGNYYDPETPYQGAVAAARLLPNSRLLTYAGWGHTAFFRGSYCIDTAVTTYFTTLRLPRARTVCPALGSPFESISAAARARADAAAQRGLPLLPEAPRRAAAHG
ncbi:MAG TPA: alpha/beta hydrolase [Mycobacteriales bacterium]